MTSGIRIMLVDDHALVRGALSERLKQEALFRIVAKASSADEALEMLDEYGPDIVLMDIDMPGLCCFDATRTIRSIRPETKVIFLSAFMHDRYIQQALEVGARGYLTKREPPEKVAEAIREVASGGAYFSEEVRSRIMVDGQGARLVAEPRSRAELLTARELEVLRYIARGMAKKDIASTMHLSVKTVDRHNSNLMAKLDIHDRVELARFAIREGLAEA